MELVGLRVRAKGKLWIIVGYNEALDMFDAYVDGRYVRYFLSRDEITTL